MIIKVHVNNLLLEENNNVNGQVMLALMLRLSIVLKLQELD